MKRHLAEGTVIFFSVFKWFVIAACIGIVVGFSTSLFLTLLELFSGKTAETPFSFVLLPFALVLTVFIIKRLAPDAEGHGTEKVIEAIHQRNGRIKLAVVPVKLTATLFTLVFGGSAGKEGPCAQIGAGLASFFADLFKFSDENRRKLVICGISAGFAAVFGTPIAGAIFAIEVLYIGKILYDVMLPSFVAGIISFQTAKYLGMNYNYFELNFDGAASHNFIFIVVAAGLFFGIVSALLIEILKAGKTVSDGMRTNIYLKAFFIGGAMVALSLIFGRSFFGLGLGSIREGLSGEKILWYAFAAKMLFTSMTLNFGGSGGIVTPIFFIGVTAGSLFADIFGLDRSTFAGIGMVALLAGSTNTPIASSIMAVELFGAKISPWAALACVISFLITGHRSVYPSQIIGFVKSSSIEIDTDREVDGAVPGVNFSDDSLLKKIVAFFSKKDNR